MRYVEEAPSLTFTGQMSLYNWFVFFVCVCVCFREDRIMSDRSLSVGLVNAMDTHKAYSMGVNHTPDELKRE